MNYLKFLQKGLRTVVKSILQEIAKNGLISGNYYCISFKTKFPGVVLPDYLIEKYPNNMTIVLQHEFWNLKVFDQHFSVTLIFAGKEHTISIPFCAIYKFEDPSQSFVLDFIVDEALETFQAPEPSDNNIINLNSFRNNDN